MGKKDMEAVKLELKPVDKVVADVSASGIDPTSALVEQARKQAFLEGEAKGRADAEAKLEIDRLRLAERMRALDSLLAELRARIEEGLRLEIEEIIRFGIELTQEIMATDLIAPKERIAAVVDEVISGKELNSPLRIRIPEGLDEDLVVELDQKVQNAGLAAEVVRDKGLGPFDVVVELGPQVVDGRVGAAIERVAKELGGWK